MFFSFHVMMMKRLDRYPDSQVTNRLCFECKIRFHVLLLPKEWKRTLIAYFKQKRSL